MITKKLFLASSAELKEDRKEFEIFIGRKNKDWVEKGVFLDLVIWEDFLDAMSQTRLQDEYNKAIRESDLFVTLFWTKVGQYTEEEFATAFGQFKATNKPFIFTYFKDEEISISGANQKDLMSLWAFQEKLKALGHFKTVYKNMDDLKFQFDKQLDKLVANARDVRIDNLYVGAVAPTPPVAGPIQPCPYPGLAYFGPQNAESFFGREQAIQALVLAITKRSFTALVGSSGSGKSSVVLAGLAPRLDAQGAWRSTYFRIGTEPDKNPFAALARALQPLTGERGLSDKLEEVQKLADKLASRAVSLTNVIAACRAANPGKRILLIADQFEEVFTFVPDEALRNHFIDALIDAFPDPGPGAAHDVCLVLTLRADFFSAALRHRPLADKLQDRVENLGPMTRDELREAIVKPAERLQPSVTFELGLVGTILDDVEKRPGSLPLLQFALREMWGRLKTPLMTRADYDAIGCVEGALAKRAQAIFEDATKKETDASSVALFRHLFTRLVTIGEGAEDTRRIVGRDELAPEEWTLAQRLAGEDNRLVVTAATTPGQETVEVAHEALIRNWPAVVDWVNRDRAFISWRNQLKQRVGDWRAHPEDEGTLLRGGPLVVAEDWHDRRRDELSEEERAYVEASVTLREEEERQKNAKELEIRHQNASLLGALASVELYRGNIDSALRLAIKAARADLAVPAGTVAASTAAAQLAAAVSQADWCFSLIGHEDVVSSVAFSSDGSHIVTASRDKTARIWEVATGKQIGILSGHEDVVLSVAFNSGGSRIVTASKDKTARIWGTATAEEIMFLRGHEDAVTSAAFSPDGSRIVTASKDKTARIWDAATAEEIVVLRGHQDDVNSAAFSSDGSRIITASGDKSARIWDAATANEIGILRGHERTVTSAAFSSDGSRIVTASWDKSARIWDAATANEINALRGHRDDVNSAAFSPDGARIVTASTDNTVRIWDAATANEIMVLRGHERAVTSATFSPDGSRVATASWEKTARVWDATTAKEIKITRGHKDAVTSAAFSPDGSRIVTASKDKTARIWDAETAEEIVVLSGHESDVNAAAFSPDGSRIVTASWDYSARIWDAATANEIGILRGHEGAVTSATFSPDGSRIVTASSDNTARIWDAASANEITVLRGHEGAVTSATFSPDGTRIITASRDRTARVWDSATAEEIMFLRGHEDAVTSAAFSPDGSRIVTASWDHSARIWDAATAKEIAALRGPNGSVNSAAFSRDGSRIVTASSDNTVRIWDAATANEIVVLRGHESEVNSAAFSPDGTHIITASGDHTARIWDAHFATMSTKDLLIEACTRRLKGLTKLTREEMRLAGYPESDAQIDVCEGVG